MYLIIPCIYNLATNNSSLCKEVLYVKYYSENFPCKAMKYTGRDYRQEVIRQFAQGHPAHTSTQLEKST